MTLTLEEALVVDADLAADVRVFTLINVAAGLWVQESEASGAGALKAKFLVSADVGAAAVVVQTLIQAPGPPSDSLGC